MAEAEISSIGSDAREAFDVEESLVKAVGTLACKKPVTWIEPIPFNNSEPVVTVIPDRVINKSMPFNRLGTDPRYWDFDKNGIRQVTKTSEKICRFLEIFFKGIAALLGFEVSYSFLKDFADHYDIQPVQSITIPDEAIDWEMSQADFAQWAKTVKRNIPSCLEDAEQGLLKDALAAIQELFTFNKEE